MYQQPQQYVVDPDSPQASTEFASIQDNKQKNTKALEWGLQTRRPVEELVSQGIMTKPGVYNPAKMKQLERAQTSDILKHKIEKRPDKQYLINQHILKVDSNMVSPMLAEKREILERNQLKESLNSKLAHRPGSLELVEKGVLHLQNNHVNHLIRDGSIAYPRVGLGGGTIDITSTSHLSRQHALDEEASVQAVPVVPASRQQGTASTTSQSVPIASTSNIICLLQPQQFAASISTASSAAPSITSSSYSTSSVDNRRAGGRVVKSKKEYISKFRGFVFHNYVPSQSQQQQVREIQQEGFLRLQDGDSGVQDQLSQLEEEIRQRDRASSNESGSTILHQQAAQQVPLPPPPPPLPPLQTVTSSSAKRFSKTGLEHFTVSQLKQECRQRNLPRGGPKNALIRSLEPFKMDILRNYSNNAMAASPASSHSTAVNSPTAGPTVHPSFAANQQQLTAPGDHSEIISDVSFLKHSSSAPQFDTIQNNSFANQQQNILQQENLNLIFSGQQQQIIPNHSTQQPQVFAGINGQSTLIPINPGQNNFVTTSANISPQTQTVQNYCPPKVEFHEGNSNNVDQIVIKDNSIETIKMLRQKMKNISQQIIRNLQMISHHKRTKGDQYPEIPLLTKENETLVANNSQLKQITSQLVSSRMETLSEALIGQLTVSQNSCFEARLEEISWLEDVKNKLDPQEIDNGFRESLADSVGSNTSYGDSGINQRSWSESFNSPPQSQCFVQNKTSADEDLILIDQIIQDDKGGSRHQAGHFKQSPLRDESSDMLNLEDNSTDGLFGFSSGEANSCLPSEIKSSIDDHFYDLGFGSTLPMSPMQTDDEYSLGVICEQPTISTQSIPQQQNIPPPICVGYGQFNSNPDQSQLTNQFPMDNSNMSNFNFDLCHYDPSNNFSSINGCGALSANFSGSEQILTPRTENVLFQSLQQNSMDTVDNDVFLQ